MGVTHILFFVIAAAAPLTAIVGAAPLAYSIGNGAGAPMGYVIAGLIYLLFSVGFTAMSRHVGSAGAFYAFVSKGLGSRWALAAGAMTLLTYYAIQIAIYAFFGIVIAGLLEPLGLPLPWWAAALICVILVDLCGRRQIEFSGWILGICMLCEIVVLMVLNLLILAQGGPEGISATSFLPSVGFSAGIGVSLLFAVASFLGFEATVIFAEEAKRPRRTIPMATYLAVICITLFYAFSAWCMVIAYGPSNIRDAATADSSDLFVNTAHALGGSLLSTTMSALLVTSLFACILSFHNTISRYLFAGGREAVLPKALAQVHPHFGSTHTANRVQSLSVALIIGLCALFRIDPYATVYSFMAALSALGVLSVQILVGISILRYFARTPHDTTLWQRVIAPVAALIGLVIVLLLALSNLPMLTGATNVAVILLLPAAVIGTGLMGWGYAVYLSRRDPARYDALGTSFLSIAGASHD
ncbi:MULTISPECIES: APC family permease [Thioclava]|uniref:APC family permease n=1 Tax=Thioclava kandeliae TaxID=3070818 RepID=A0ABV1SDT6_9RHOB